MLIESRVVDRSAQDAAIHLAERAGLAVRRGLLKVGFRLGAKVAQNIESRKKWPPGTRMLSRSFLVPQVLGSGGGQEGVALGTGGGGNPPMIYAHIEEEGGTIEAKNGPYLMFQTADGSFVQVASVVHEGKHYARDAVREMESAREAPLIMAGELAAEFRP